MQVSGLVTLVTLVAAVLLAVYGRLWFSWPKYRIGNMLRIYKELTPKERFDIYNETQKTLLQALGLVALAGTFFFSWRSILVSGQASDTARDQYQLAANAYERNEHRQAGLAEDQRKLAKFVADENARSAKNRFLYERRLDAIRKHHEVWSSGTPVIMDLIKHVRQAKELLHSSILDPEALRHFDDNHVSLTLRLVELQRRMSIETQTIKILFGKPAPEWTALTVVEPFGILTYAQQSEQTAIIRSKLEKVVKSLDALVDSLMELNKRSVAFIIATESDLEVQASR